ncbi:uncharacterized protein LOC128186636 [Crassostrea angulata]|uniref:uncharacterized protein LOC128186636 n=1 Tax=Magallana angulata TaxID=2784310 RepID=UPI0022B1478A|nr:uncharacterized protein LOC128186636 [Crassostrea angulata]
MGMHMCLLFCVLYADTLNGLIPGGVGVCNTSSQIFKCCTNYQLQDDICKPCIGTFGENCTAGICLEGYYGFGCKDKCNCTKQTVCNRFKGCITVRYEKEDEKGQAINKIIPVIFAVVLSVGSILVVSTLLLKQNLESLRKNISGQKSSQHLHNGIEGGSEESGEDYSQMTRASNNYNVLSFNRKFNAISTVNATDEEDFYDDTSAGVTCSSNNGTNNGQDSYVTLALTNNHVLPIIRDNIKEVQNECQTVDNKETYESGDTYVTLIPNHVSIATRKL